MLGLSHKGHLGPGADADITIYSPHENRETMFELPKFVIKSWAEKLSRPRVAASDQAAIRGYS